MAAGARSDRRIARIRFFLRVFAPGTRRGRDRDKLRRQGRKSGRVDLYLESARNDHITVALAGRGRRLHCLRGLSMGIRAPMHERADASAVTRYG
jgi:hypothetical protein